ncbi:hypothetical protein MIND_00422800 [Mycena indigotica]|uniref:Nucleoporin Nup159/Nup146 N-terminal domain-containing protein n=1 Tax=Mycena indigotica TaxID=2126181 RepID=A0A8H6W7Y9_9AGAR|nr:uncharacterized protein MIND_00422800 [Mycena indigotica]KAF7306316.1 hypothetical protein MIND_00422800 [Mycena indigotica]
MAFAPLRPPDQSPVKLDPNFTLPQADGFTYPTFRLLNKQSRVTLSPEPLAPSSARRTFATTNANGGWFAASTSNGLIVSPSRKLREAFKTGGGGIFQPDIILPWNPVTIAFACNATRLLAGLEDGQVVIYDTGALFSSSSPSSPLQVYQASSGLPLQILPNPSNDGDLAQLVAIVRMDGTVEMLDAQMQTKGAWRATDADNLPVAASWSPKGKQLAVGLRSGDILTFGFNNAAPLKHIPPTASPPLVSLDWLGPAFTFRTSYFSDQPAHHIVSLNHQSNITTVVQLAHPFPSPERTPNSRVLILPRWNSDASGGLETTLMVVGDNSSTDLEVHGSAGSAWYQQSQENPLTVPLDKNDEDTYLLSLESDLTDEMPIMLAYLNDGTVQAWYITHPDSKPYSGLIQSTSTIPQPTAPSPFSQTTSVFGQSSFGQNSAPSPFGQNSVFSSNPSPFGGSSSSSTVASQPVAPPMSATPSISMGDDTGPSFGGLSLGAASLDSKPKSTTGGLFGGFNSSPSPLPLPPNHPANQPANPATSKFSDPSLVKPAAGFGAFGAASTGAFSNPQLPSSNAFTGGAFGGNTTTKDSMPASSAFGKSGFGQPAFGQPAFGQPAFGQPAFGQPAFGKPAFGQTSFASKPASTQITSGAPASGGFGAFAATGPSGFTSTPTPSSPSPNVEPSPSPAQSSFGAPASVNSAFGGAPTTSVFGKPSNSSPSPAQSAFGGTPSTSVFGTASAPSTPASAFSALTTSSASGPSSPSPTPASTNDSPSPLKFTNSTPSPPTTGAFSNLKTATTGFKPAEGFGAFGNSTPTPASSPFFKPASPVVSAFGPTTTSLSPNPSTPVSEKPAFGATSALGTPKSAFGPISASSPSPVSAFSAFATSGGSFTPAGTPTKSFSDLLKAADEQSIDSPSPATTVQQRAPVFTPPPKKDETVPSESSFGSLSLGSEGGSFVEVEAETDGVDDAEDSQDEPPDDDGFLSESFGSGSEDDDAYSRSPSPTTVPLPPSRSPSSTPNADALKPHSSSSTQSDGDESDSSEESRLSTIREESETPPGSPEKKPTPPSAPLAAPVPITPSLGIGLGRPSTRPAKSSPLAAAPMSRDEAEKLTPKARPASPKLPFGVLPPAKTPDTTPKPSRPKTPPLSALSFASTPAPTLQETAKSPSEGLPLPTFPKLSSPILSTPSPSPAGPSSFFVGLGIAKTPEPSAMSAPTKGTPSMPFIPVPPPTTVVPSRAELSTMEEGMQKECALLFAAMARGLEDFKTLAQTASQKRVELGRSARPSDTGEQSKWSLRDATQFGRTMKSYEQELQNLKETEAQWEKRIRDLENNLLKAGTRREEVGRFLKAQHDKDFAKMLKARSLGPEHLETQTHLRRTVRAVQDRVQKLESHLHEHKKRLSRADSGKPGLRAPTLDTLNRTFRNMDMALDKQSHDVEKLHTRISKLNLVNSHTNGSSGRDKRLPDPVGRQRPLNVTPDVAITTAAALNAERSAHNLKRALLGIRKEPLLNTQAASATPPPLSFQTPQRGFPIQFGLDPVTPMMGFDFPEDNFNPSSPPPSTRRGAGTRSRVSGSVQLKRSPGQSPATPSPPTFDWGPLPTFDKPKLHSPENSLSGSWISEGFKGFGNAK